MIFTLSNKPTSEQISQMSKEYETMIKIVVDIRRRVLAGGGEMHSDCEAVLLDDGSEQDDAGVNSIEGSKDLPGIGLQWRDRSHAAEDHGCVEQGIDP